MTINCRQCGHPFDTSNWRLTYCSDECREARLILQKRASTRRSYRKNRAKRQAYGREYGQKVLRFARYGITEADFDRILEEQDGACAICRTLFEDKKPCIDHDHETGEVRGLLCYSCNSGIGQLRDDPELLAKAIRYLKGEL